MNEDRDKLFREIADSVIDNANKLVEDKDSVLVSTAMLYGIARFCAFTVASQAENVDQFKEDKAGAADYFKKEFERMIGENLDDYEAAFKPPMKYEHLMKPVS